MNIPLDEESWDEDEAYSRFIAGINRCDAVICFCPRGRYYVGDGEGVDYLWRILVCLECCWAGTHARCMGINLDNSFRCPRPFCCVPPAERPRLLITDHEITESDNNDTRCAEEYNVGCKPLTPPITTADVDTYLDRFDNGELPFNESRRTVKRSGKGRRPVKKLDKVGRPVKRSGKRRRPVKRFREIRRPAKRDKAGRPVKTLVKPKRPLKRLVKASLPVQKLDKARWPVILLVDSQRNQSTHQIETSNTEVPTTTAPNVIESNTPTLPESTDQCSDVVNVAATKKLSETFKPSDMAARIIQQNTIIVNSCITNKSRIQNGDVSDDTSFPEKWAKSLARNVNIKWSPATLDSLNPDDKAEIFHDLKNVRKPTHVRQLNFM